MASCCWTLLQIMTDVNTVCKVETQAPHSQKTIATSCTESREHTSHVFTVRNGVLGPAQSLPSISWIWMLCNNSMQNKAPQRLVVVVLTYGLDCMLLFHSQRLGQRGSFLRRLYIVVRELWNPDARCVPVVLIIRRGNQAHIVAVQ